MLIKCIFVKVIFLLFLQQWYFISRSILLFTTFDPAIAARRSMHRAKDRFVWSLHVFPMSGFCLLYVGVRLTDVCAQRLTIDLSTMYGWMDRELLATDLPPL